MSAKPGGEYEHVPERPNGVPRSRWFDSSKETWAVVVGLAVLWLVGLVFWFSMKP
jgi:hypothetical protein